MIKMLIKDVHANHENSILKTAIKNNSVFVVMNLLRFICTHDQALELQLKDLFRFSLQLQSRNEQISLFLLEKILSLYPMEHIPLNEFLLISLKRSFVNVSRKLLLNGASSSCKDETGHSVLYYAIETGNCDFVQLLVDHYDINVNETVNDQNIIFHAINNRNSKISSILIKEGTDIFCKNINDEYLIEVYIKQGWFLHVKHVFEKGFNKCYDDDLLFFGMCTSALNAKSSVMFHIIVQNYFATKIARWWRKRNEAKKKRELK